MPAGGACRAAVKKCGSSCIAISPAVRLLLWRWKTNSDRLPGRLKALKSVIW